MFGFSTPRVGQRNPRILVAFIAFCPAPNAERDVSFVQLETVLSSRDPSSERALLSVAGSEGVGVNRGQGGGSGPRVGFLRVWSGFGSSSSTSKSWFPALDTREFSDVCIF